MNATAMKPISIVVPTLNEADNLPLLFSRIFKNLRAARIPFEIIVIDDHSTDATAAITRAAATKYHTRLLMKQGKPGKAYSLQEGFAAARYDIICMIDADLQYPPEAISHMYHKMLYCDADIIITNRIEQQTSKLRKLASKSFHLVFTRALFGINYDTQSGLKLFKKHVLKDMQIAPSPWTFDLEFVIRSLERKYVILSEDIAFAERYAGVPKINVLKATFELAWQSLKLRRNVASKRVKVQYDSLKPLQRSFNWIAVLAIGFILAFGTFNKPVDALSLPSLKDLLGNNAKQSDTQPTKTTDDDKTKKAVVIPPVKVTTDPVSVTVTPTTPTTTTTDPTTPATTTTTTTTTAAASSPAKTTNTSINNNALSSPTASTSAATDLQTGNGKPDSYYTSSHLSTAKTNRWLTVAGRISVTGLSILGVGLVLLAVRRAITRVQRSALQKTLLNHSR